VRVFGNVMEGMDVVRKIEKTPTARGDKPVSDVIVTESGVLPMVAAAAAVMVETPLPVEDASVAAEM
jgi:hypothetical protein